MTVFRYAYLEYKNEEEAFEASDRYKDMEIEGEKLYVIKAVAVNREKFGKFVQMLLSFAVDVYFLEVYVQRLIFKFVM